MVWWRGMASEVGSFSLLATEHVAAQWTDHGVPHAVSWRALGVASSTFYERHGRQSSATQRRRERLDAAVRACFEASGDQRKPAEAPVGQQHHSRLEPVDQIRGHSVLCGGAGPDLGVQHGTGAALRDRHHPGLRERGPLAPAHTGTADPLVVRRRVGDVEARPVDRGRPPPRHSRPRRARVRRRPRDARERRPHRLSTQALPGGGGAMGAARGGVPESVRGRDHR